MGRSALAVRARAAATVTVVAAVTLLAACGTERGGTQPGSGGVPTGRVPTARATGAGPAAGSAGQAQALAGELLSRVVLPAGTRRIPWRPPPALSQTVIALGVPTQADVHRLWLVPLSVPALAAFIRAHPLAGLAFQGFGHAGGLGGIISEQTTFFVRSPPPGIEQAQLALEFASAGRGSAILRTDGEVIWYPPRSAAEHLAPARGGAVTVTARFLSPWAHTVRRTFTSAGVVARLAGFLNGLHAATGGLQSCPMIDVSYTLAFFSFSSAATARPFLIASTDACAYVRITAGGRAQPGLADPGQLITRAALAALAGHPAALGPAPGQTTPPAPAPAPSSPPPVAP
jgi:hypothetical protein